VIFVDSIEFISCEVFLHPFFVGSHCS